MLYSRISVSEQKGMGGLHSGFEKLIIGLQNLEEEKSKLEKACAEKIRDFEDKMQQIEKEIFLSRKRLTDSQHLARMGDFIWNISTGNVYWSEAMYDLLGYGPGENINLAKVNTEIHHPDDLMMVINWLNHCIGSGKREHEPKEYRIIKKDGTILHVQTHIKVTYENGAAVEIFGTVQDITGRLDAEHKIRESEARYRLLAESAPVGIVITRHNEKTVYINRQFTEMTGYSQADIPDLESWWLIAFSDEKVRQNIRTLWNNALNANRINNSEIEPMEYPIRCNDGSTLYLEFRLAASVDFNYIILTDVTQRKILEAERERSNYILGQLLSVAGELTLAQNTGDVVNIVKQAAHRLSGADGVTVVLRDGDNCHYVDEEAIAPLWKGKRFPLTGCISGWVMLHAHEVVIEDVFSDDRIPHDIYRRSFVKSMAMTPVRKLKPLGAIGAYWADNHKATASELSLLEALSNMTASVFDAFETRVSLYKSHKLNKAIVESSPMPVISLNNEGFIQTWNQSAFRVFGWKEEDVSGKVPPFLENNALKQLSDALGHLAQKGFLTGMELPGKTRSGEGVEISISAAPITDENFGIEGYTLTIENITERKKQQDELHKLKTGLELQVEEKTRELRERVSELERFHDATIEREFRMKELSDEIKMLKDQLNNIHN